MIPELIVIFAPDHYNGLFYDLMPPFVLATAATSVGDYLTTPGPLSVASDLAGQLAAHVLNSDVDLAISHRCRWTTAARRRWRDHRQPHPLSGDPHHHQQRGAALCPYRHPRAGAGGGALSGGLDKRVLILGSGGLSHEPPVPLIAAAPDEIRQF
jgi:2,3-dihydroxyphenylpropionate 1,2-dioxygenase